MAGRKMEGNEEQRRKKAREAKERGLAASQDGGTKGASKQRHHLARHDDHLEKVDTVREGKQDVISQAVGNPEIRPRSKRWHRDHHHDVHRHPHAPDRDQKGKMPPSGG